MVATTLAWAATFGAVAQVEPVPGPAVIQRDLDAAAQEDCANLLSALGLHLVRDPAAGPTQLEAAALLVHRALALKPDDLVTWQIASLVASMQDPASPVATEWSKQVTQQLARLDPASPVYRLARLSSWCDDAPTAEQQVARLESLTTPSQAATLSGPVAAHLAWDLYRLQLRRGDRVGATNALSKSIESDPTFPPASAALAALAQDREDNPVRRAEWLLAAIEANPSDIAALRALAALLLQERDYADAARVLGFIAGIEHRLAVTLDFTDHLMVDQAIAMAGAGDVEGARSSLRRFLTQRSVTYREYLVSQRQATPLEAASMEAPAAELLQVISALLAREAGAVDAKALAESAVDGLARGVRDRAQPGSDMPPEVRRLADLESAYAMAALGATQQAIDAALAPWRDQLSPEATATILAMVALHEERYVDALAEADRAGSDPAIALVRGEALMAQQQKADAARALHQAVVEAPGTMIGVLAQLRLETLLGQRVPSPPVVSELHALIEELPPAIDRMLAGGVAPIDVAIRAESPIIAPFDIPRFVAIITNTTSIPLAVSDLGPLTPFIGMTWEGQVVGFQQRLDSTSPTTFPITGSLQLAPRQRVEVAIDGRIATELLFTAFRAAGPGINLRLTVVANPQPLPGRGAAGRMTVPPGPLGVQRESELIQIGKFLVTPAWIEDTLPALKHPDSPGDLRRFAMLASYVGVLSPGPTATKAPSAADRAEAAFLADSLAASWPKFPPTARTYLLLVSPAEGSPELDAVYALAKSDPDVNVRAAYVLRRTDDPQDPYLEECAASGDAFLSTIARAQTQALVRRAVQAGATGETAQ